MQKYLTLRSTLIGLRGSFMHEYFLVGPKTGAPLSQGRCSRHASNFVNKFGYAIGICPKTLSPRLIPSFQVGWLIFVPHNLPPSLQLLPPTWSLQRHTHLSFAARATLPKQIVVTTATYSKSIQRVYQQKVGFAFTLIKLMSFIAYLRMAQTTSKSLETTGKAFSSFPIRISDSQRSMSTSVNDGSSPLSRFHLNRDSQLLHECQDSKDEKSSTEINVLLPLTTFTLILL